MSRRLGLPVLLLALTLAWSSAAAWELRIDDAGGPADLGARVNVALEAWQAAGAEFDEIDRTVLVRYASAELLGPDALSLVVTGGPPGVDIEVLVRADAGARLNDALVIAMGIALGGSPGAGILEPRLLPDEVRTPAPEDAAALAPGRRLPGDVTGDGRSGFADLLRLAESWGQRGVNLPADLDGDGVVDASDLEILREHYQFAPLDDREAEPEAAEDDADLPATSPESGSDELDDPAFDDPEDDPDDDHDGDPESDPEEGPDDEARAPERPGTPAA